MKRQVAPTVAWDPTPRTGFPAASPIGERLSPSIPEQASSRTGIYGKRGHPRLAVDVLLSVRWCGDIVLEINKKQKDIEIEIDIDVDDDIETDIDIKIDIEIDMVIEVDTRINKDIGIDVATYIATDR